MTFMEIQTLKFEVIPDRENYPYELLLLADETIESINKYIFDSTVYCVKNNEETIAAFCLYEIDDNTIELKNIAVAEKYQNRGCGSAIISFIKKICKNKYRSIIVGTGDCGIQQIRFYEKNGFCKYDIQKNFFIENFEEPIFENGNQLKDMVMLKYEVEASLWIAQHEMEKPIAEK